MESEQCPQSVTDEPCGDERKGEKNACGLAAALGLPSQRPARKPGGSLDMVFSTMAEGVGGLGIFCARLP